MWKIQQNSSNELHLWLSLQFFNSSTLQCERMKPNNIVSSSPCNLAVLPTCTKAGRFPLMENCSCFYICDQFGNGQLTAKIFQCPGTSVYSPISEKCTYENTNIIPTMVYPSNLSILDAFPSCVMPGRFRYPNIKSR